MAQSTVGVAAKVRDYRARLTGPNADWYEGDVDVIMWLVNDTPERSWSPSEVARAVKVDASTARRLLDELVDGDHIRGDDRGAWTRYRSRRA